ncbi:MAG: GNAT family N-acetyltransferase [Thermoplasmata archaeon]
MIREMTEKDVNDVLLLTAAQSHEDQMHSGGDEDFDIFLRRWQEMGIVTEYKGEIVHLVDKRDGQIVGYCSLTIGTDGETVTGELSGMYVRPDYGRRGIALALLERITEVAREKSIEVIFAWTRQEATAAKALYERAGFEENVHPVYYRIVKEPGTDVELKAE